MSSTFPVVHQLVGTASVTASGSTTIAMAKSNCPFDDLTMIVKPIEDNSPYTVDVYLYGRLMETHTYPTPTGEVNAWMLYPDMLFPANVGVGTIPQYFDPSRKEFLGFPVSIVITNLDSVPHAYEVYSLYKTYQATYLTVEGK